LAPIESFFKGAGMCLIFPKDNLKVPFSSKILEILTEKCMKIWWPKLTKFKSNGVKEVPPASSCFYTFILFWFNKTCEQSGDSRGISRTSHIFEDPCTLGVRNSLKTAKKTRKKVLKSLFAHIFKDPRIPFREWPLWCSNLWICRWFYGE